MENPENRLKFIRRSLNNVFSGGIHAKRIDLIINGSLGVTMNASLVVPAALVDGPQGRVDR
jgi:hypothetical protein